MDLKTFTYTNKGGKPNNEDYLKYYSDIDRGIYILADGLGGHGNGEIASELVVHTMISNLQLASNPDIDYLKDTFQKANTVLLENQEKQNYPNMKTTAVVLTINADEAIWGHLGDSRLYYFSDDQLKFMTRDHSVTYKKYLAGEILYQEINSDEDRSSLLGVFGNKDKFSPDFVTFPQKIKKGDAFLLCTDGFWEYVFNEEMLIDLLKSSTPKQWADLMLLRHIRRIKQGNDNFSLVAVFVE